MRFLRFSSLVKPFRQLLRVQMTIYRRNNFCWEFKNVSELHLKNFALLSGHGRISDSEPDFLCVFFDFWVESKPFVLLRAQMALYRRSEFYYKIQILKNLFKRVFHETFVFSRTGNAQRLFQSLGPLFVCFYMDTGNARRAALPHSWAPLPDTVSLACGSKVLGCGSKEPWLMFPFL